MFAADDPSRQTTTSVHHSKSFPFLRDHEGHFDNTDLRTLLLEDCSFWRGLTSSDKTSEHFRWPRVRVASAIAHPNQRRRFSTSSIVRDKMNHRLIRSITKVDTSGFVLERESTSQDHFQ